LKKNLTLYAKNKKTRMYSEYSKKLIGVNILFLHKKRIMGKHPIYMQARKKTD
jgi:hypothetical protein